MNILGHFKTVTHHRHAVIRLCFRVGIGWQGLFHDLSKYSPQEFWIGAKYYQGNRSPNDRERELYGYSLAWMHHKGRNRHHFEYWTDFDPKTREYKPVEMPLRYVKEMFCDRIAASQTYRGKDYDPRYPLEYFRRGNTRAKLHPKTADLLEDWLVRLAEDGEDAAIAHIRSLKCPKTHH